MRQFGGGEERNNRIPIVWKTNRHRDVYHEISFPKRQLRGGGRENLRGGRDSRKASR